MEVQEETMVDRSTMDTSVSGKRVTVIGAARSGVAVAQLLSTNGAHVFVTDSSPAEKLQSQIPNLQSARIEFETGHHSDRVFDADLIVLSPGVPSNAPVVREAKRRRLRIVSEIEAASWFCKA